MGVIDNYFQILLITFTSVLNFRYLSGKHYDHTEKSTFYFLIYVLLCWLIAACDDIIENQMSLFKHL